MSEWKPAKSNRGGARYGNRKRYLLRIEKFSVNGKPLIRGIVNGEPVHVWQPKYIMSGINNLRLSQITILGYEIVTPTGPFFKPVIKPIPPGFQGDGHFFVSLKGSFIAMLRNHRGRYQLAYVKSGQFQSEWTTVSARPTRPTRKDSPETKKLGFVTQNRFKPLNEPEKKVKPKQEKKVKSKEDHFPPIDSDNPAGGNPTTSYNPTWGGNVRELIKKVKATKSAAKQAAKQAANVSLTKAETKTEKKVETPVFVPKVPKLRVGLDDDFDDGDYGDFDDGDGDYGDFDDGDFDDRGPGNDNRDDWGPGNDNDWGRW